jgi:hypothetical protein
MMIRGFNLYCDILVALKRKPKTAAQLHVALGEPVQLQKLRRMLRRLRDGGALRYAGRTPGKNGERVYGFADGRPEAPLPAQPPAVRMEHISRFLSIWDEITEPTSVAEVVEATGCALQATRKLLKRMVAGGIVGTSFDQFNRRTALYQRGVPNAPMPRRLRSREAEARLGRELHEAFTFRLAPLAIDEERAEP